MKILRIFFALFCVLQVAMAAASRVDTIAVASKAMDRDISVSVITPDRLEGRLPVVYLLHGYGDNNTNGYFRKANVRDYADKFGIIIIVPDGGASWYFDSPMNPKLRYETFVSKELVDYVDSHYPTIADRNHRAITGLSMGGHGALYLAIRHQSTFGVAGSMSGGVDFRPFPKNWEIAKSLGDKSTHEANWNDNTVMAQLPRLKPGVLQLIIDCGTEDFFYGVNCNLHEALCKMKIPHEFTTRPGSHNWTYWNRSLRDHFLFFNDYFTKAPYLNIGK